MTKQAAGAGSAPTRTTGARADRRLLAWFVAGSCVAAVAITAMAWFGLDRVLRAEMRERARFDAERATRALAAAVGAEGPGRIAWGEVDARIRPVMDAFALVRVRVFGPGGELLYTSDDSEIGRAAPMEREIAASMAGLSATIVAPAHIVWRSPKSPLYSSVLAATYVPLQASTGALSVEACADVTRASNEAGVTLRRSVGVVFASLVVAFLALTAVMQRAQRVIVEGAAALGEARARTKAEEALRAVVEATAGATGDDFFRRLVARLADSFGARWAYLAERDGSTARVAALWAAPDERDAFERVIGGSSPGAGAEIGRGEALWAVGARWRASAPVLNSAGDPIGEVCVLSDRPLGIEAHHESILSILAARAGAELERQRATAALEGSRERLRVAERLASIGALAAGIGHDLNNLLLPMRGQIRALRAAAGADDARAQVQALAQSVEFLRQLGENLRMLADGGSDASSPGAPGAQGESTRLAAWWAQIGGMLTRAIPGRVRLEVDLPESIPAVGVAPSRVTQAALNLLVNAGDAMVEGREGVVRLWAERDGEGFVRLCVRDNGRGMSEHVARHAFDPFFTTKPRGASTGLGLALVQQVAGGAGGSVEVDSAEGEGTTVALRLPVATAPGGAANGRSAAVSLEDNRLAAYARALLAAEGWHAAFAPAGAPAGADVWLVDEASATPDAIRAFLSGGAGRRALVVGQATGAWGDAGGVALGETVDRESLRRALGAAGPTERES